MEATRATEPGPNIACILSASGFRPLHPPQLGLCITSQRYLPWSPFDSVSFLLKTLLMTPRAHRRNPS